MAVMDEIDGGAAINGYQRVEHGETRKAVSPSFFLFPLFRTMTALCVSSSVSCLYRLRLLLLPGLCRFAVLQVFVSLIP